MNTSSYGWAVWLLAVLLLVWLGTVPLQSAATAAAPTSAYEAQVVEIGADQGMLRVERTGVPGRPERDLTVDGKDEAGKALRARLKSGIQSRDLVEVTEVQGKDGALAKLEIRKQDVPAWQRWLTLAGAALLVFFFAKVTLGSDLKRLVVGLDGRTSNSKVQMAVWFGVLMVAYLSTLWLRFCLSGNWLMGAVDIPPNLLALSGLSALSFAGAKAITQGKQNALAAAGMTGAMKAPADRPARLSDLVQDDAGNADFGDFQMLLVSIVAALTYLVQIFMFLGVLKLSAKVALPDADSTLLAAFGLGQGAYLVKKAASGPKPPAATPAGAGGGGAGAAPGGAAAGAAPAPAPPAPPAPPAAPAGGGGAGAVQPGAAGAPPAPAGEQAGRLGVEA